MAEVIPRIDVFVNPAAGKASKFPC